jgi:hypothetical protein
LRADGSGGPSRPAYSAGARHPRCACAGTTGHHRTPSASSRWGRFAPHAPGVRITRFFAARASPESGRSSGEPKLSAADPLRANLALREPIRTDPRSDVPCRQTDVASSVPHVSLRCGPAFASSPPAGQGGRRHAPVKERSAQPPRTPSIDSSRSCDRASCPIRLIIT